MHSPLHYVVLSASSVIADNTVVPSVVSRQFPMSYKKFRTQLEERFDALRSKSRVFKTELSLL